MNDGNDARSLVSSPRGPAWKLLFALAVSALLLNGLYRQLDWRSIGGALRGATTGWLLFGSAALIVPMTWMKAYRFFRAVSDPSALSLADAIRLTLAAASLNLVAPAKSGDLVRSWILHQQVRMSGGAAIFSAGGA